MSALNIIGITAAALLLAVALFVTLAAGWAIYKSVHDSELLELRRFKKFMEAEAHDFTSSIPSEVVVREIKRMKRRS